MKPQDKKVREYVKLLLEKGLRENNKDFNSYRNISIEVNPIPQANGSARVKIGNTEVLVGVKLDIGEPYPDSPDSGVLITSAELSPIASPDFESGPPGEEAIELARVVDRAIRESKVINFDKLCVKKGEKVWIIFLDIYPLNYEGNLLDAASLGAVVALKNAVFPKYNKKTDKIDHKELTKTKISLNKNIPILCTFCKIDKYTFVDPGLRETQSSDSLLSIATLDDENICAMQKGGFGTITKEDIEDIINRAIKIGKKLRKLVK